MIKGTCIYSYQGCKNSVFHSKYIIKIIIPCLSANQNYLFYMNYQHHTNERIETVWKLGIVHFFFTPYSLCVIEKSIDIIPFPNLQNFPTVHSPLLIHNAMARDLLPAPFEIYVKHIQAFKNLKNFKIIRRVEIVEILTITMNVYVHVLWTLLNNYILILSLN